MKKSGWKMERAGVNHKSEKSRSNKYSKGDQTKRPATGARSRIWVGGYDRSNGTHVEGYYRSV